MSQVVTYRERNPSEMGHSITFIGGGNCGEEFRMVEATMDDGSKKWLFVSDSRGGYFKQVFVPFYFEHPDAV